MTEIIPYFAGLITLLFGVGFALAIRQPDKNNSPDKTRK
jgi:uncharacterized membrane protein YeiB